MAQFKSKRTKKQIQADFLEALEATGNISMSCIKAKVGRRTVYHWRDEDQAFKKLYDVSMNIGIDMLEDEANRRALHGVKKPIYQGGKRVGYVQEYSDTLLIFLLKGKKPEMYKDRHELTGKDGEPLPSATLTVNIIESGPKPVSSEKEINLG